VTKLFCIHGNFQTSKVWAPLARSFKAKNSDLEVISVSLKDHPQGGFEPWTQDFCNEVDTQAGRNKPYLLGYSLGGRLALHACIHRPDLWQGVVVVGADPGLGSSEEKKHQFTRDCNWADRLKKEPLEELVREWDEQPVFCGIENSAPRNLDELDPTQLSQQFEVFSKGLQENLVPKLAELRRPPILFLSGEKDSKYQKIGEGLAKSCPLVSFGVIQDAGHRVPWENPNEFVQALGKFIN
jgi:2-succinyl-6-hydroxy-2,4-cyclohexadiene-1-carboxylate synthase